MGKDPIGDPRSVRFCISVNEMSGAMPVKFSTVGRETSPRQVSSLLDGLTVALIDLMFSRMRDKSDKTTDGSPARVASSRYQRFNSLSQPLSRFITVNE